MKTIFAVTACWWLVVFSAKGQDVPPAFERAEDTPEDAEHDPFDPMIYAPKLVRVQVEHIEVAHKDLTRLMMEDEAVTADAKALRMKVQELVEKDEAKVIDTQIVLGRSGQKQTTESVHEFIYPVEYEPMNHMPPREGQENTAPTPQPHPFNPAMPSMFETKNLGSMLETEPTVGEDGRLIDLRLRPESVWHTGNTVWNESKDESGNVYKVAMPDFYKTSLDTSITCIAGQYVMLGVNSQKDKDGEVDPDRKIMVFVKCDVLAAIP